MDGWREMYGFVRGNDETGVFGNENRFISSWEGRQTGRDVDEVVKVVQKKEEARKGTMLARSCSFQCCMGLHHKNKARGPCERRY